MNLEDPKNIQAFWDSYPYSFVYLRTLCNVTHFEFLPKQNTPLFAASTPNPFLYTVRLRWDTAIAPLTLANHLWQVEELVFTKGIVDRYPSVTLIDVGANMGLFSRQVLSHCLTVTQSYAYEPEPENFACLVHNMKPFANTHLEMSAIGESQGTAQFHLDLRNCGNNSLVSKDLSGALETATVNVAVVAAEAECQRWMSHGKPIFYKSDTQGYDEMIICLLPLSFWDHVVGGIFEVAHMDKPDFDRQKFMAFLNKYENKVNLSAPDVKLTTEDIMTYLDSEDYAEKLPGVSRNADFGFWR